MIVDAIAEEMAESNHEANVPLDESKRMSGLERETTILSLLNESLSDEVRFNSPFTVDDAKEFIQRELSELEKLKKDQKNRFFCPTTRHDKRMRQLKSSLRLLEEVAVRRDCIPELHDKSYDSSVMLSRDHGGLLYVAPKFLYWAKQLMKKVRASITMDMIASHGAMSQEQAYKCVIEDQDLESLFKAKAKDLEKPRVRHMMTEEWIGCGEN
jgi:hypothetical protein